MISMLGEIYKVVKIIDDKQIVINAGADNNVVKGQKFEIYQPSVEVIDKDINQSLGTLDYVKARVSADTVLPKMSICKRFVTKMRPPILGYMDDLYTKSKPVEVADTLNIDPKDITGGFESVNKQIKVGDLVRKALG